MPPKIQDGVRKSARVRTLTAPLQELANAKAQKAAKPPNAKKATLASKKARKPQKTSHKKKKPEPVIPNTDQDEDDISEAESADMSEVASDDIPRAQLEKPQAPNLNAQLDRIFQSKMSEFMDKAKKDLATPPKQHQLTKKQGHKRPRVTPSAKNLTSSDDSDSESDTDNKRQRRHKKSGKSNNGTSHVLSTTESESSEYESDGDFSRNRANFGALLGGMITKKLKKKIWSHKFVEFAELLPQNLTKSDSAFVIKQVPGKRELCLASPKTVKYVDIQQWNEAFGVYMSLYLDTAPNRKSMLTLARQMLTYQKDINKFHKNGQNWVQYDRQFRISRATSTNPTVFGDIRHDLLLDVTTYQQSKGVRQDSKGGFRSNKLGGFSQRAGKGKQQNAAQRMCFLYNSSEKHCERNNCSYMHGCTKCGGKHPQFRCRTIEGYSNAQPRVHTPQHIGQPGTSATKQATQTQKQTPKPGGN